MRIPKRFLLSAFIALSFASSPLVEAQTHEDTDWNIRVGIQRFHDDENFAKAISTVIKAVQEVFGAGLNVVFIPMNEKEIREAAKKKYAEILLTDATLSRVVDATASKPSQKGTAKPNTLKDCFYYRTHCVRLRLLLKSRTSSCPLFRMWRRSRFSIGTWNKTV